MFRRGDLPEPPPKAYRDLPIREGWTLVEAPTMAEVDRLCREAGARSDERFAKRHIGGCAPAGRIIYPAIGPGIDAPRQRGIIQHENGHAWDLNHSAMNATSSDWVDRQGRPVRDVLTPEQMAELRWKLEMNEQLRLARQVNPFAMAASPPPAENLFRAR